MKSLPEGPSEPVPPLVLHATARLFVLVGAVAVTTAGTGVTSDEGAGAYQAVLLNRGRWILSPTNRQGHAGRCSPITLVITPASAHLGIAPVRRSRALAAQASHYRSQVGAAPKSRR